MSGPDSLRAYIKNSSPITSNLFLYGQHEKGILITGENNIGATASCGTNGVSQKEMLDSLSF